MDQQLQEFFVMEVYAQTQIIETGNDLLRKTHGTMDVQRVGPAWLPLQGILIGAATMSRVFWGSGRGETAVRKARERQPLRELLGVTDDSPLFPRALRNRLEHIDEYIECWHKDRRSVKVFGPRSVGRQLPQKVPGYPVDPQDIFGHYNPETGEVRFHGLTVSIPAVVAESARLAARIEGIWDADI